MDVAMKDYIFNWAKQNVQDGLFYPQLRAMFTMYAELFEVYPGTREGDALTSYIYAAIQNPQKSFEDFDLYIWELLV